MSSLLPAHLAHLPAPSANAVAHGERVAKLIAGEIAAAGGWLSFARYMELALHAPGFGYYSAGARKFGADGDFVTAPELGGVFARTLARQAAQVLRDGISDIIELGAGSGKLACGLLTELAVLDCPPRRYLILETSAELKTRQRDLLGQALPHLASRVAWLDTLPASIEALVIGNEVLDAMPVHIVKTRADGADELGVTQTNGVFEWGSRPASGAALAAATALNLAPGYTAEIHLAAGAFVRTLAASLTRGVVLLIDYGFPAHEYYHPQRDSGTLMCHYHHHAHPDPLCLIGLQDISAHVNFSAIAHAAIDSGLDMLGYANQAQFLINCGITDVLAAAPSGDASYVALAAQAQKLVSPAEMGELFKVVALGKNYSAPLLGFSHGDKRHTL